MGYGRRRLRLTVNDVSDTGAEEAGDELESDAEANDLLQQRRQRFWWTSTTLDEIVDFVQANRAEIADLKKKKVVPGESRCHAVSGLI